MDTGKYYAKEWKSIGNEFFLAYEAFVNHYYYMRYTSIDISPTSGRIRRGFLSYGRVVFDSEYTFKNIPRIVNGEKTWDLDGILSNIVKGLCDVGESDYISLSAFSYDFVLLDGNGDIVGMPISFQDDRFDSVREVFSQWELYQKTGQCPIRYSTFNQLMVMKDESPELFDRAERLLFIPDYLRYRLTGVLSNEFTIASTSSLLDIGTGDWNFKLLKDVGIPERLFYPLQKPGSVVPLLDDIKKEIGYDADFMLVPSDRLSLSLSAAMMDSDTLMIAAGGLSTLGVVADEAIISDDSMKAGFSNFLRADGKVFITKRIPAGRIIRSFRDESESGLTYNEIENNARKVSNPDRFPLDDRFYIAQAVSPVIEELVGRKMDKDEIAASIYVSIVSCYSDAIEKIESLLEREFDEISICGGIVRDRYLNILLALKSGKIVLSGDDAPSSLASLLFMAETAGEFGDEKRERVLRRSLYLTTYRKTF